MTRKIDYSAYGFRFKGDYQNNVAGLSAIGFELVQSSNYRWHGLHRGEQDVYIFQYTTHGYGAISIGEKIINFLKAMLFLFVYQVIIVTIFLTIRVNGNLFILQFMAKKLVDYLIELYLHMEISSNSL
ncbi:hypothetical protein [Staphylococcus pseudoxylosus]|uniref:hypothetical protein n=1 Tax=Staphylococcus pseudoxylosus TaxID=2282419 RepID=UPI001EF13BAE|nr:hypothetical protein [Staphylococcus pseudoxylosus]